MNNFYLKVKTIISENILNQELYITAIFFKDKNIDIYNTFLRFTKRTQASKYCISKNFILIIALLNLLIFSQ